MTRRRLARPVRRMRPKLGLSLGGLGGGGGALAPPAALYQGGQELRFPAGHALAGQHVPRDAEGYYVSRTTGERLVIDAGYSVGDAVGAPRLYTAHGVPVGTVVGLPATGRRAGFDAISDSDYGEVTLSEIDTSLLAFAKRAGVGPYRSIIDGAVSDPRTQLAMGEYADSVVMRVTDSGVTTRAETARVVPASDIFLGGSVDGTSGALLSHAWDEDGAHLGNGTASHAGPLPLTTAPQIIRLGRQTNLSYYWNNTIYWAMGWDGEVVAEAQLKAILDAYLAGTTIDQMPAALLAAGVPLPQLLTDGLICGAYDPAAPGVLYDLAGTGDAVVVAQP